MAKTTATAVDPKQKKMADQISGLIADGLLDSVLTVLDDALDKRVTAQMKQQQSEQRKQAAKTSAKTEKVVPEPPKRTKIVPTIVPEVGQSYQVVDNFPKIGGAKVKFVRFKKNEESKAVIEMVVGVPGAPKGKNIVIPVAALAELPKQRTKKVAKKSAAKKTTKKSASKSKK